MNDIKTSEMMSVGDVAQETGFSTASIRRWIADGIIRAHRRGMRTYAIPKDEVALINSGEVFERQGEGV